MKRILLFAVSFTAIVLIALMVWLLATLTARESEVNATHQALIARGEHLDVASLVPQGGVDAGPLMTACAELKSAGEKDAVPMVIGFKLADSGELEVTPWSANPPLAGKKNARAKRPESAITWHEVKDASERLHPLLEAVRRSAAIPGLVVSTEYDRTFSAPLDSPSLLVTVQYLHSSSQIHLWEGRMDPAIDDIVAILDIAQAVQGQMTFIAQITSSALVRTAYSATWNLIQTGKASEPQLARLQKRWSSVDHLRTFVPTLRMERAFGAGAFAQPNIGNLLTNITASPTRDTFNEWMTGWTWETFYKNHDEVFYLNTCQDWIDSAILAGNSGSWKNALDLVGTIKEKKSFSTYLSSLILPPNADALGALVTGQTEANLAITALALERFRLARGEYPESLNALVPEFCQSLPADPIDGKPLQYKVKPDSSFLLYGLGTDGVDGGADSSRMSFDSRRRKDIVWPTPAKKASAQ